MQNEALPGRKILEHVVAAMKKGDLRPGDRIIPKSIADRLGTSTIPVREALFQLVGREMLVERHREGFYVAPLNVMTLRSLYDQHKRAIGIALQAWRDDERRFGTPRDIWDMFATIVERARCPAMSGVQRYLAGRLLAARAYEMNRVTAREIAAALVTAMRAGETAIIGQECDRFHDQCIEDAPLIVQRMTKD